MFRSIKGKIVASYTLIFGVLVVILSVVVYNAVRSAAYSRLDAYLSRYASTIHSEIEDIAQPDSIQFRKEMQEADPQGFRLLGTSLVDIRTGQSIVGHKMAEIPVALVGVARNGTSSFLDLVIGDSSARVLIAPIDIQDTIKYALITAGALEPIERELDGILFLLFVVVPASLMLAGGLGYYLTQRSFRPLTAMIAAAEHITANNLESTIPGSKDRDEVGVLVAVFNQMVARVRNAFASQRQFVADASHELRTPISAIAGELDFVSRIPQSDHRVEESIANAKVALKRLRRLSEHLLLLSKLDSEQFRQSEENLRLDELIVECMQYMRVGVLEKQLRIEFQIEDEIQVRADPHLLSSAITNVLDNAVQYSEQGGLIIVKVFVTKPGAERVIIQICDTGIGIAPSDLPRVFERFFRTSDTRSGAKGSGLGLPITDSIIRLLQGTIVITSHSGQGTTVTISLPSADNPSQ